MIKFNSEIELREAYAKYMDDRCQDDFYLTNLDKIDMYSLKGGYTPMNAKYMGITTKSKYILYIPEFGYTEID